MQGIKLLVSGERALFTRPEMKVERVSYDVLTPSAARGILEAIHWKPAICWVIDRIHVLKPIRFQSMRRNEVSEKVAVGNAKKAMRSGDLSDFYLVVEESRQQRAATLLVDVAYIIEAHFELTDKAGIDDNAGKHLDIFCRRARKGQCFHQPSLGTRECDASFRLIEEGEPLPSAISETQDLGFMLWDIDHAGDRMPMFFKASMKAGVITIPQPHSEEIYK